MKHITNGYGESLAERSRTAGEHDLVARLHKVNLDLLPVLHELLRTRSVTRTAQSFNMTQPAVSRALRQLRDAFGDPLLVSLGRNIGLLGLDLLPPAKRWFARQAMGLGTRPDA